MRRRPDPKLGEIWRRKAGKHETWQVLSCEALRLRALVSLVSLDGGRKRSVRRAVLLKDYERRKDLERVVNMAEGVPP